MRVCIVAGCGRKYLAKGYCSRHYDHLRKLGNTDFESMKIKDNRSKHPLFAIYNALMNRCYNPNDKGYKRYGGRGITVCEKWKNSFWEFAKDMGEKPFDKAQIDRIDNNKGYEPSNCRWVDRVTNIRNSRTAKLDVKKVKIIKSLLKKGHKLKTIADKFNVDFTLIGHIKRNRIWKDV
jgi:hypothetical protein